MLHQGEAPAFRSEFCIPLPRVCHRVRDRLGHGSGVCSSQVERRAQMGDRRASLAWTLGLFFFSGATSLVYEVLWTRRLSLTFGHTVLAVSTVLTVFMSGLALGSFLAGRWSDRERRRLASTGDPRGPGRFLAVYGGLEIFIGVWAVLSLFLLNGVEHAYLSASRGGLTGAALHGLVFLGSFLVLLPPTTAMGATLPAFTQLLVATREDVGSWLSRIYGWNTLGACFGAAVGGFVLLPQLGLKLSVAGAAAGNLVIGVLAILASRRLGERPLEVESPDLEQASPVGGGWLLPLAFGLSGFAAMVYQLGWTRGLILSIGSSTYSFAIILTAFLASLGLGSLIYKRGIGERLPRVWHLGVLQFVIALSGLLATYGIGRLPEVMVRAIPALDKQFSKILAFDFLIALALMFLPTLAMGLTFPLVTHLYTDQITSLGKRLGEAYAANTCGAILGSFLGGFVLVPTLGAQKALLGAVVVNLLVGLMLAWVDRASGRHLGAMSGVAATGLVLVFLVPAWDPTHLSAGAGIFAKADYFLFRPTYYKDGVSATVTVGYNGPHCPYVKVNGKTDASLGIHDMAHQVLLGLLPAALHPTGPKQVAVIGLGAGVTAAAAASLDSVETVSCAELEPAVVEIQRYFGPYNRHLLQNPKLDLQITDGRTFIMGSPRQFDVIISQPSNPWIAGIGNLYTEDFYRSCAERLKPGGLMCQWFYLYSISDYDLDLVLSTFFSVYPEGMIFQIGPADIFLVGTMEPLAIHQDRIDKVWAEEDAAYWLQLIGLLKPEFVFGTYVATRAQVVERLGDWKDGRSTRALNTDDRPLLEFRAPLSLYVTDPEVMGYTQSFPDTVPPQQLDDPKAIVGGLLGRIQLNRLPGLEKRVEAAVTKGYPLSLLADAILRQRAGDLEGAEGLLRAMSPQEASRPEAQILLGDLSREAQQWQTALVHYQNALASPLPGSVFSISMKAGECAARANEPELALELFERAASLEQRPDPLYQAGEVKLIEKDETGAYEMFGQALKRDPYDYVSLYRTALIEANQGKFAESKQHALASYRSFPELRHNVELLMRLAAKEGDVSAALRYQAEANSLHQRESELAARKP